MFRHFVRGSLLTVVAVGGMMLADIPARAATLTVETPTGSTVNGLPVDAQATFTTQAGSIQIFLQNLQANPTSIAQLLSDISFTLVGGTFTDVAYSPTSTNLGAGGSQGTEINVAANGTTNTSGLGTQPVATGWALTTTTTTALLDDLNGANAIPGVPPAHLIIGPPGPGGVYSNANNSIAGNDPHNPFLDQTATFRILSSGITGDTTVANVVFSFGTTPGLLVGGVPEPSAVVLALVGFAGLGVARLRRRRTLLPST